MPQVTPIQSVRTHTRVSKEKMKEDADVKSYVKPSNLSEEDKVLATRYPSHMKATTLYDPNPHAVRGRKGAMITAKRKDRKMAGNSSFFKKLDDCISVEQEADDRDDVAPESSPPTVPPEVPSMRHP